MPITTKQHYFDFHYFKSFCRISSLFIFTSLLAIDWVTIARKSLSVIVVSSFSNIVVFIFNILNKCCIVGKSTPCWRELVARAYYNKSVLLIPYQLLPPYLCNQCLNSLVNFLDIISTSPPSPTSLINSKFFSANLQQRKSASWRSRVCVKMGMLIIN